MSVELPLRANLSALENIAVVPQYVHKAGFDEALAIAWGLMHTTGATDFALKRDPMLSASERFLTKLLRAVAVHPPLLLIDRPALLLPDIHYPPYLMAMLDRLTDHFDACRILEYTWNAPLYPPCPTNPPPRPSPNAPA